MTNFEKWQHYTSGLSSPDSYIKWGYKYLVSAALQRRVWMPPKHRPLFPNMYVVMVGRPGLGKGQVIKSVDDVLRYHKFDVAPPKVVGGTPEEMALAAQLLEQDYKIAQGLEEGKTKNITKDAPLLIPIAANAITFESLVEHMSQCMRRKNVNELLAKDLDIPPIYTHSSLCFCLEELGSLLRDNKNTKDIVRFLLECYDCNDSYEYSTKTRGKDRIKKVCLNLFGGTTPNHMAETFDDGLLNDGFASRTFFIYAEKNRKTVFFIPELTEEQKSYRQEIIAWVKHLTGLFGQVAIDDDTKKFLQNWLEKYESSPLNRASSSRKLEYYYARKQIHLMKLAMANHFGESLEMYIPKFRFEEAIEELHEEEKRMHLALQVETENPLAAATTKITNFMNQTGKHTKNELLAEFWGAVRESELEEILNYLQATGQCKVTQETVNERTEIFYAYVKPEV